MSERYLHQTLKVLEEVGHLVAIPDFINHGLSERIELREYQEKAFQYFITYYENDNLRKNKQVHNLFHMATGSGKTVIMAGLILYLYTRGYRNFLFFVDQTNIIEKTKENFLNSASGKYLFADTVELLGSQVNIKEVQNFAAVDGDAINICFTTTQKLHLDLTFPRENTVTIEDFEDDKIVLISDESHHVNTVTRRSATLEEAERSWEYSVQRIFRANRDNILLEFTATCDLRDPLVKEKYLDKIVFDYALPHFRESGYTKDFQNLQTELDLWGRALGSLIMSEYRRDLFADCGQNIKPVVLLKSNRIADSEDFYEEFFSRLESLTGKDILALASQENTPLIKAIQHFKNKDASLEMLAQGLKLGFGKDNSIIMNGSNDNTTDKQLAVNSLEEASNPYRIIFTVDMLNEGWDVLNLFDIVRLYETRQSGSRISPYTIREAQLIGRGARYCPFVAEEGQERFKRKYDHDLNHKNRMLETLLYHSKQDSRYIHELQAALKETGLLPESPVEVEYKVKDNFKDTDFFKYGLVFANKRVEKTREAVTQMENRVRMQEHSINLSSSKGRIYSLFDEHVEKEETKPSFSHRILLKELPLNILFGAMDSFELLKFDLLKSRYPNLKSKKEFLTSSDYVGDNVLLINTLEKHVSGVELFEATKVAMAKIADYVGKITQEYEGTKEFTPSPVRSVVKDKKRLFNAISDSGEGVSQSQASPELALNIQNEDWFVYEDNFGTSEEKAFVKYFHSLIPELREVYDEIYLIRNERLAEFAIYDFGTGERFEPDYLLFLRRENASGYEQEQIYIEPKGDHLLEHDCWKEEFLLRIEAEGIPRKIYADNHDYKIIGLPFYNRGNQAEFSEAIRSKLFSNQA